MKLSKILAIGLAVLTMTACSDDDEFNFNSDGNVTVDMAQPSITLKENKGYFNVPVVVSGEANGYVQVTVEVQEATGNPAMDDVHYIVTSKTINIASEDKVGNVEIKTVDDGEINENREFIVTIVDAKGAKIGNERSTPVTIRDNDSEFYEKLMGKWALNFVSKGAPDKWDVNVVGYEETEAGYNETLYITGIMGYSWAQLEVSYFFDKATNVGYLEVPLGTLVADGVDFGSFTGTVLAATVENGYVVTDGTLRAEWNDMFTEITFQDSPVLYLAVFDEATGDFMGGWKSLNLVNMTR